MGTESSSTGDPVSTGGRLSSSTTSPTEENALLTGKRIGPQCPIEHPSPLLQYRRSNIRCKIGQRGACCEGPGYFRRECCRSHSWQDRTRGRHPTCHAGGARGRGPHFNADQVVNNSSFAVVRKLKNVFSIQFSCPRRYFVRSEHQPCPRTDPFLSASSQRQHHLLTRIAMKSPRQLSLGEKHTPSPYQLSSYTPSHIKHSHETHRQKMFFETMLRHDNTPPPSIRNTPRTPRPSAAAEPPPSDVAESSRVEKFLESPYQQTGKSCCQPPVCWYGLSYQSMPKATKDQPSLRWVAATAR